MYLGRLSEDKVIICMFLFLFCFELFLNRQHGIYVEL